MLHMCMQHISENVQQNQWDAKRCIRAALESCKHLSSRHVLQGVGNPEAHSCVACAACAQREACEKTCLSMYSRPQEWWEHVAGMPTARITPLLLHRT